MARRNLLLCFDAFGTLFRPKRPIAEQYAAVAKQCGLGGFSTEEVEASFKVAFALQTKTHPNYGKATGMGASRWWTNVIHDTFQPLSGKGTGLPGDLAPRLLHRFSSNEGYDLFPAVASLLRSLKQRQCSSSRIVVGVITNSDDRVPSILSSFGLRVSPLRFGVPFNSSREAEQQYDIDLHCMSYDVGFSKPDRRIFYAAEDMAVQLVAQKAAEHGRNIEQAQAPMPWLKLYVGDEYEKDVVGARRAGWNPIFVGAKEEVTRQDNVLVSDLDKLRSRALEEVFREESLPLTIRAKNSRDVIEWLIEQYGGKH